MSQTRDPRKDPRTGDMLRKHGKRRIVICQIERWKYITVREVKEAEWPSIENAVCLVPYLPQWRKWAADAEVLYAAD